MKKKIKVVHLISNLGIGGAELVLYQLLAHMHDASFEHEVVYFHSGPYKEKIEALGIKTHHIKGIFPYDILFMYRLVTCIKKLQPDCLHTSLWAANFLGRLLASYYAIKHIETLHNNVDQNGMVRTVLDRLTAFKKGHIVAVSDGIVQSVVEYTPWFASVNAIRVIKNGIASHTLPTKKQAISRQSLGLTSSHFVIGSVGRFEPVKNYTMLLTAFALLYDACNKARLVLVGQGSQEYFLRQRANDLGIDDRVIFITGKDAQPYYPLFDCFTLSSYKEGISMALLEAMKNQITPVVTSITPTHDVIVSGENGILVPAGDAQQLANALLQLITSRALKRKLAHNAALSIKNNFNQDVMISAYKELYQSVTKSM